MTNAATRSVSVVDGAYRLVRKLGEDATSTVFLAAVDPERFDYATLYAYSKAQGQTNSERLRQAEAMLAHLRGQNPTPAALRKGLEQKGIPLPGETATLKVGKAAADPARFAEEWTGLAGLGHANVARILGGGSFNGRPYYAMEPLADAVPPGQIATGLAPEDRIGVVLQAAAGLLCLHGRGVVHRQLHPGSLATLRRPDGSHRTVVTFLGLGDPQAQPNYLAPELLPGSGEADQRADVYALGAVLCGLFTRRVPYQGHAGVEAIRRAAAGGERPFPPEAGKALPGHLAGIVAAATALAPADRYPSMREFLDDLTAAREGGGEDHAWHYRAIQARGRKAKAPAAPAAANEPPAKAPQAKVAPGKAPPAKATATKRKVPAVRAPRAAAPSKGRPGRWKAYAAAGVLVAALGAGGAYWYAGKGGALPFKLPLAQDPAPGWTPARDAGPATTEGGASTAAAEAGGDAAAGQAPAPVKALPKAVPPPVSNELAEWIAARDKKPLAERLRLTSERMVAQHGGPFAHELRVEQGKAVAWFGHSLRQVDLSPLTGLPLERFVCQGTKIGSIAPLAGMPLVEFSCTTPVVDYAPLAGMELDSFGFDPSNYLRTAKGLEAVRAMRSLKSVTTLREGGPREFRPADFWKRYDAGAFFSP